MPSTFNKVIVAINKVSPKVIVAGENWDAANVEAVKAAQEETTFLVHPFDQVGQLLTRLDNLELL